MNKLAEREAERRAFIETLKPKMVEILDAAVTDRKPIDHKQIQLDVAADLAEDRAKHRRRKSVPI